jgi:hypothetical protein
VPAQAFPPIGLRTLRWVSLEHGGLEHCTVRPAPGGIEIESVVVGDGFGARYRIELAPDWTVRAFQVRRTDGAALAMRADAPGRWSLDEGRLGGDLAGAIDIDLAASPFTNTLPIRRAPLALGASAEFRMLYVPFDTLEPFADAQRYTRLAPDRYRYEAVDGSFAATITVDADGLVTDYPPLFRRAG